MDSYCSEERANSSCGMNLTFSSPKKMELNFGVEIKPVVGGTRDYTQLDNKPSINGIELVGDKTNEELLIQAIPNEEIEKLLKAFA